jgi:adenylate cyclase
MDYAVVLHKFRRDVDAVYRRAGELMAYASEQKLRVPRAKGAIFRGWARALIQDVSGGLTEMLDAIASEQSVDTPGDFTVYYEMLAEIYGRAGRYDEGLNAVDEAFVQAESCGIVFWNAELHRRRGELLLAAGARRADVTAAFEEALACARVHEALSLELRAAVSLARMYEDPKTASAILRPVYERFTEGLDTPDLIEACELLEASR